MSEELFTTRMRKATRKAHAISDALVNAKLLFALNNNSVWAEGLLIFYEIFKFLEKAVEIHEDKNLGKLFIKQMNRTSAFEEDLTFYLGRNWKQSYKIRESVKIYLNHLQHLLNTDPDLLMVYVYHLYMGLLSGGQILRKKRDMQCKIIKSDNKLGEAVTDFGTKSISELKKELREKMNLISDILSEEKKNLLIEESIRVFELNNSIIKTVQGADKVAFKNIMVFVSCLVITLAILYYYGKIFFREMFYAKIK